MADSEMERLGTSLVYAGPDSGVKWQYTTGLFLESLLDLWQVTGNSKYLEYVTKVIDSFIEENGSIKTYHMTDFNLDKINSGRVLLQLYKITRNEKYKHAAEILYEQLQKQPRTSEGGFWHKQRYPWQMWLDGIYMSGPFYAEFGLMFEQPDAFEDVIKQIKLIDMHTRDAQTGLRYHAWDESNKQAWANPVTGCSPHFWGRAMGWYSMALVDVLDYIPSDHPNRSQLVYILTDLLKAVRKYQDNSGMWYQIVDLGGRSGNYLETSCSAMFIYSIAKAVSKGYIDQTYRETAVKGYNGIIKKMLSTDDDSRISLNGICSVAGLGGNPYRDGSFKYYISEPVVSNDLKGVGPFIMAGLQMDKMIATASR
ncbi:MAG: glycoside hydrolase family 88 protein [Calditrichia bacterium]